MILLTIRKIKRLKNKSNRVTYCTVQKRLFTRVLFGTTTISLNSIAELRSTLKGSSPATAFVNPSTRAKIEANPNPLAEAKRAKLS